MGECHHCGRSLALVPDDAVERARESLGFGAANDRLRRFCSVRCKALWKDVDPVLERTHQATLAAFDDGADGTIERAAPDAIAWAVE